MDKRRRSRSQRGVTIIEMLVVVTIIALFAGIVGTRFWNQAGKAKRVAAKVQINNFLGSLGQFKLDTGLYPTTEQGLKPLRERPENMPSWNGPYLPQEVPLDPWGRPYLYRYPGEHGDEPDLISLGADGQPGGEGEAADVVSWKSN
ncbi:type II secretion system protein GspG [Bryobacterales bacterium F-183]|nr:type II secretion system protein GspG [Bryobacterales bacterium F-183]